MNDQATERADRLRTAVVTMWPALQNEVATRDEDASDLLATMWRNAATYISDADAEWLIQAWLPRYSGPPIRAPGVLVDAVKKRDKAKPPDDYEGPDHVFVTTGWRCTTKGNINPPDGCGWHTADSGWWSSAPREPGGVPKCPNCGGNVHFTGHMVKR